MLTDATEDRNREPFQLSRTEGSEVAKSTGICIECIVCNEYRLYSFYKINSIYEAVGLYSVVWKGQVVNIWASQFLIRC